MDKKKILKLIMTGWLSYCEVVDADNPELYIITEQDINEIIKIIHAFYTNGVENE